MGNLYSIVVNYSPLVCITGYLFECLVPVGIPDAHFDSRVVLDIGDTEWGLGIEYGGIRGVGYA